jgi:hypothetical protein
MVWPPALATLVPIARAGGEDYRERGLVVKGKHLRHRRASILVSDVDCAGAATREANSRSRE